MSSKPVGFVLVSKYLLCNNPSQLNNRVGNNMKSIHVAPEYHPYFFSDLIMRFERKFPGRRMSSILGDFTVISDPFVPIGQIHIYSPCGRLQQKIKTTPEGITLQ